MPKRKAKKPARRKPAKRKSRGAKLTKLPKHAVTLIVFLRAKEGQQLLLEAELRALVAPTRKEEGCLQYDLHRGADQPGTFLFHEIWETRDHHTGALLKISKIFSCAAKIPRVHCKLPDVSWRGLAFLSASKTGPAIFIP